MVAACAKVSSIVLVREWHRIEELNKEAIPGQIRALRFSRLLFAPSARGASPDPSLPHLRLEGQHGEVRRVKKPDTLGC
ncbi:hypothetical protein SAMN04488601_101125 [Paenibacillus sp. 453mf]|nr:hypothetical protein SAMN04488601_101125 [Paenibacillus sp. 453mf]